MMEGHRRVDLSACSEAHNYPKTSATHTPVQQGGSTCRRQHFLIAGVGATGRWKLISRGFKACGGWSYNVQKDSSRRPDNCWDPAPSPWGPVLVLVRGQEQEWF